MAIRPQPLAVRWCEGGRLPTDQGNVHALHARVVDYSHGARRACTADLQRPAPGRGAWLVDCETCGVAVAVPADGAEDDPAAVRLLCGVRVVPREDPGRAVRVALEARRRELVAVAPRCPRCGARGPELLDWRPGAAAGWRCRACKRPFTWEPK